MIGVTLVTILFVGQSYGFFCEQGETNYTSTQYKNVIKEVYVATSKITKYETCSFFWWRCKIKTRTRYISVKRNTTFTESYSVVKCCPGFTNGSNGCAQGCDKGMFGDNCTDNCSWCPSYCEKESGDCLCNPGSKGENCTEMCPEDKYGANCTHTCRCSNNSACNAVDGSCNCTSPGWQGTLCDNVCTNNTYGLYCNETCSCNENQTCHHVDGSCICKSGWHGVNCSEECDAMHFGVDCLENCTCDRKNTDTCDKETGYCYCIPGYIDIDCAQECEMGTFGENCLQNCSNNCNYTDYCDHINGSCLCAGMRGPNCSEECNPGTFGPNCVLPCNCTNSQNNTCNNLTGQCTCMPGWTGRVCEKECNPGTFGPNCVLPCNCTNSQNNTCNNLTGQCTCMPGWTGRVCDKECDQGTYGPNCTLQCNCTDNSINKSCDHLTGQCDCMPGWTGQTCETEEDEDAKYLSNNSEGVIKENMLYLLIGLSALFILITVTVTAFCIRRKKVCRSLFRHKGKRQSLISNSQENPHYNSSLKDVIPISNLSTERTQNNYEEAMADKRADIEANHGAEIVTDFDKSPGDKNSELAKTDIVQTYEEADYSVTDKDNRTYDEEQLNDPNTSRTRTSHRTEELYDSTQDDLAVSKDIQHEYNTFKEVLKIQREDGKLNDDSASEEDYDVISHTGHTDSKKTKAKDLEHYSSFEQVRKLSLQNSVDEEEDTYNELNEHLQEHKSALINATQYHHISFKDKTVDGERFDRTKSSQRQSSTSTKSTRQKNLQETEVIIEENEDDPANIEDRANADDILEEESTEVIYDECDIDETDKEPTSEKTEIHKAVPDVSATGNANINEIIYEECDENDDEKTSAVVYEDVDSESHKSESSEEEKVESVKSKPEHVLNEEKSLIKRSKERRREDYEEFVF